MRRAFAFILSGLFAFALLAAAASTGPAPVSASSIIAPSTSCSNGEFDTPGLGMICQVSIVNRINSSGGSAAVTIRECHGAAGDPTAACTTTTNTLTQPVTSVTQCNASVNGGGGTLRCNVWVINNFYGVSPTVSAVTVNQCVGSGDGIANNCNPFPATTTGAAVTQCNGSANGGTLVRLECTATGTTTSSNAVTINQCNGSANGGGSLVICSTKITNNIVPAATPRPTPTNAPGGGGSTPRPTTPPTSVDALNPARSGSDLVVLAGLVFLSTLSLITMFKRQKRQTR
ncbi:MAG: hypothetical protein M3R57_00750 [Chloroflexota bacterium]|nr:hypothetical protein [Chloroflexota bacterium]